MIPDTDTCHAIFNIWYPTPVLAMLYLTLDIRHRYLPCYTWHMYPTPVLAMLYLTLGTRHRYLPCYTWHLVSDTSTCHAIPDLDIWHRYLTCYTWHLIPDTWYLTPVLTCYHLTWYCDTWLDTITADPCITWHIHDYHFYRDLTWLLYCYQTFGTPELLYSWTPVSLNPWERVTPDSILLLIPVIG